MIVIILTIQFLETILQSPIKILPTKDFVNFSVASNVNIVLPLHSITICQFIH